MSIIPLSSQSLPRLLACAAVSAAGCKLLPLPACFGRDKPVPQWGLDAAKTPTPAYAKDAAAVILFDEYVETVDDQGRAVEREREAIRILKPQGRHDDCAASPTTSTRRSTTSASGPSPPTKSSTRPRIRTSSMWAIPSIPIMLSTEQGPRRASSRCRCRRNHHLRIRGAAASPISRRRSGIFRAAFPSSFRPLKSICPPAAPTPRPGTDSRPSSPSKSRPTTGAGRSRICPRSTCAM